MTLNSGIQKGTVLLVTLAVGVALGISETDEVGVPEETEVDLDEDEGNEFPSDKEDELPLLSVDDVREPVLLGVGRSDEPVLVVIVGGELEPVLLTVVDDGLVVGTDCERLVLVVCTGVLGELELKDGVEPLAEPVVELDRVDDRVGTGVSVLPRLEELGVAVGELGELGTPPEVDVRSSPDEVVVEGTVEVTPVEELSVPETVGEPVIPLLTFVGSVWLSVFEVNDAEDD